MNSAIYKRFLIAIHSLSGQPLDEVPYRSLQAMAKRMIRMIRGIQPTGPYRLAGWSFGGILAYEIATQLIGEDERIAFLGLLDTYNNYNPTGANQMEEDDDISLLLLILEHALPSAIMDEMKSDAEMMDFPRLVQKCQELSLLPPHLTIDDYQRFFSRWRSHQKAYERYFPRRLSIPVHIFSAQEDELEYPLRGWNSIMPIEEIRPVPVPGTHQTMMNSPNIEVLGEKLSLAIKEANMGTSSGTEMAGSPLVPIQKGRVGMTPVFCVPGAGGSVASFHELAGAMGSVVPLYGLQPRGLDGETVPHSSVSAAAMAYLNAVQATYPDGPLHLLGHSFGGWVAFEMALRLTASGRTVASLTLVDTEVPDENDFTLRDFDRTDVLMHLIEIYRQLAKAPLEMTREDIDGLGDEDQLALLHKRLVNIGLMPKNSNSDTLRGIVETFGAALRTHYHPSGVYAGPVCLALASDASLDEQEALLRDAEIAEKWKRHAPKLIYWQSQGNHMTMLQRPHIGDLATQSHWK